MKEYKQLRSSLYKNYNWKYPVIRSINQIPRELHLTYKARYSTNPHDSHFNKLWIRMQAEDPTFLVKNNYI